jgi:hypothetical protein
LTYSRQRDQLEHVVKYVIERDIRK